MSGNTKDFKVKSGIQPTVYHEAVGTVVSGSVGYNLAGASYDNVSFSVFSQDTSPRDISFNNNGTKMYVVGTSSDSVHQYTLTTAFDLSTASYDSVSFSVSSQDASPIGLTLSNNGTKMYVVGNSSDSIYQYTLTTVFDLSTASYDSVSFSVSSQDASPIDIAFNNDGTKMYMVGIGSDSVHQYTLTTAFDLSTASYDSVSFSVASQDTQPYNIVFNNNGTKMYVVGISSDSVHQYALSTAFDLSTASYDSVSFSVSSQDTAPYGMVFNNEGTKMYVVGNSDTIYQYSTALTTNTLDLSTGSVFEVTPTSDIQVTLSNPADSGTVSGATLLLDHAGYGSYDIANASYDGVSFDATTQSTQMYGMFFKPDGTKMYLADQTSNAAFQYTLSTAWDLSTASYDSVSLNMTSQDGSPGGIFFKSDGTKMWMIGLAASGDIFEYTLTTAWDLSTASYASVTFDTSAKETGPYDLWFKTDGTKMYIVGIVSDQIHEYNLSTAWDISTAAFNQSFNPSISNPNSIEFTTDGLQMYVCSLSTDLAYKFQLTVAWDISTATQVETFNLSSQDTAPYKLKLKSDGTKMYILGAVTDDVYQYSTVTPATITYDPVIQWPAGTAPTAPAIGETDVITFNTRDGGSTYQGVLAIDGAQ